MSWDFDTDEEASVFLKAVRLKLKEEELNIEDYNGMYSLEGGESFKMNIKFYS